MKLSTAAQRALARMALAPLCVTRERCSINGVTLARSVFYELLEAEAIEFDQRVSMMRMYRVRAAFERIAALRAALLELAQAADAALQPNDDPQAMARLRMAIDAAWLNARL